MGGDKTTQATVHAILAGTGRESDSESNGDSDYLENNTLLCTQSDNE